MVKRPATPAALKALYPHRPCSTKPAWLTYSLGCTFWKVRRFASLRKAMDFRFLVVSRWIKQGFEMEGSAFQREESNNIIGRSKGQVRKITEKFSSKHGIKNGPTSPKPLVENDAFEGIGDDDL
ncbi:sorting nexin-17 [Trichonephila inaurata madagascariensis]|uniref:Sorting nexin-17 n=1 Tax=Trichonephila inaurata madagascariensis TaxID=2747483 RepID=A0A8X6Y1S8_9ARAC|nr:sorting nexin-17 [Trichonephila inaurata madagascariensis]